MSFLVNEEVCEKSQKTERSKQVHKLFSLCVNEEVCEKSQKTERSKQVHKLFSRCFKIDLLMFSIS